MRFVARVADNAPDKIEHQYFKTCKWPTIVRIHIHRPAFLMDSNGSGRQCSGKTEPGGGFWSFFTHFFTFFIGERVSFYEFLSGFTGRPWSGLRKRENILADRIIGLYAIGNSTRKINDILEEQFGNRISADTISSITDRVLPEIQSWKNRPLDRVYPIVWLDAVHYKVMDEKNRPVTRSIYNVLAINSEWRKELLGMYYPRARVRTSG